MKTLKTISILAMLCLSLVANSYLFRQINGLNQQLDQQNVEQTIILQQYEILKRDKNRLEQAISVLRQTDNQLFIAEGTIKSPKSLAYLYWNERQKTLHIDAKFLAAPPPTKKYQVWLEKDGKYQSLGLFNYQTDNKDNFFELKGKNITKAKVLLTWEQPSGADTPNMTQIIAESKQE